MFQAFTDPSQITRWFGPEGFKIETLEIDIRDGGRWRFIYTGPDGTRWENRMVFLRVDAPRLLEFEHGTDVDEIPRGSTRRSPSMNRATAMRGDHAPVTPDKRAARRHHRLRRGGIRVSDARQARAAFGRGVIDGEFGVARTSSGDFGV